MYVRSNGVWSEQQKLTASDAVSGDVFGISVSIDGDTAVIGAWGDDDNGSNSGSAYVYVRSNGVWTEQQKLTASDGATGDRFGYSVSIDGDTAVIGARYDDDNGSNSGSAYVYVRTNGVWSELQKLTASDGAGDDQFGYSVSIDGDTAVIGARYDDDNGSNSGSAYVYVRSNGVWSELQKLTASDGAAEDQFGYSVSIDGDTAVIGAYADDSSSGSAYVFPLTPPHQDTPAVITGSTSANVDLGGFSFGTIIAADIDGLTDGSYFTILTPPTYGQALINPSSGVWTYIADSTYAGLDPFTVTVTDDLGGTTEQVVTITAIGPDTDGDGVYDFSDNCLNTANFDQSDIDADSIGDVCDSDIDNDGLLNETEDRFGGSNYDDSDSSVVIANIQTFSETAPADSDLDGVPDDVEAMLGEDNTSSTFQDLLDTLSTIATAKNVPAMGGIGLLALGLSMLGLGAVRMR